MCDRGILEKIRNNKIHENNEPKKSCSHGFYILQIFLRNPRGRSDPPQAENPVKQDSFLKSYYAPFFFIQS